jgi:hypothetical protein
MVKLLLDNGADADVKNNKNRRAIELAAHYGHKEIAEYLASCVTCVRVCVHVLTLSCVERMNVKCPPISGKATPKVSAARARVSVLIRVFVQVADMSTPQAPPRKNVLFLVFGVSLARARARPQHRNEPERIDF